MKSLFKLVVASMFTNLFSLPQSSKPMVALSLLTKRNAFPLSTIQFLNSSNGFSTMIAMMSVWNPQVILVPVFNLLEDEINVVIANPEVGKGCERQQR